MTEERIIEIIKSCLTKHSIEWAKITPCTDDQHFAEAHGAITGDIAEKLNTTCNKTRMALNSLTADGLICKSKKNGGGHCRWWPVGYLAELKQTYITENKDASDHTVVTDDFIEKLFAGTNFGEAINNSVDEKRKLIAKTLKNQLDRYWSGHTAYHIVVNGGFLKDAKPGKPKFLTALGDDFLKEWSNQVGDSHA